MSRLMSRQRRLLKLKRKALAEMDAAIKRDQAKPWGRAKLSCHLTRPIGKRRGYDWLLLQGPKSGHY